LFYNSAVPFHRPRQLRSRQTFDRITSSARKLLQRKHFEDLSIREVVREADASIGAFYSRFSDKRALLEHLDVQQTAAALTLWTAFFDRPRWRIASAGEIVHGFVAAAVRAHRQNAGLLRAVFFDLRAGHDEDFRARARRVDQVVRRRLTALLLEKRGVLTHPAPEQAIPFALLVTAATIREAILFEDLRLNPAELNDERLVSELSALFCSYIGCNLEGRGL
jgi:AcrR family transcriptional regulator